MKKPAGFTLLFIAALLLSGYAVRPALAEDLMATGNQFFGGIMPYNLTIADHLFRAALFLDPHVPDAWHQRARIAFLAGNFSGARAKIDTQLQLHGNSLMSSYYIRGLINGYDKHYAEAEGDFATFLAWDPDNWAANNDLAWIYFSEGKFSDAAAQAEKGLAHNSGNPWLLTTHGMALYNLGKVQEAAADLERAQQEADRLTETAWLHAYPGNEPMAAAQGLQAFKDILKRDLELVHSQK